jgi:hypothetical protein
MTDARPGSWANRDFHDEVVRRRRPLERGTFAAVVTVVAFFVCLLAVQHEGSKCRDACYDGGVLRSYQPGHAWTAYEGSWQWQGQWALGVGALVLAVAALATLGRFRLRRFTPPLSGLALALAVAWVAWRVLEPAIPH